MGRRTDPRGLSLGGDREDLRTTVIGDCRFVRIIRLRLEGFNRSTSYLLPLKIPMRLFRWCAVGWSGHRVLCAFWGVSGAEAESGGNGEEDQESCEKDCRFAWVADDGSVGSICRYGVG